MCDPGQKVEHAIAARTVTYDFHRLMDGATLLKTSEFGDALIAVHDTQKDERGVYYHCGTVREGSCDLSGETPAVATVDAEARLATMRNHTVTHLMQSALKRIVGEHVTQSGSHVSPEGLRFDFSHLEALTAEQIRQIELLVTEQIVSNLPVEKHVLQIDEARAMGAIAPFGEKYGEIVRVIKIGDFSMEFCGGTHLEAVGQIGPFVITGESSIAAGVRRLEAQAGLPAMQTIVNERTALSDVCHNLSVAPLEAPERLEALNRELRDLRKEVQRFKQKESAGQAGELVESAEEINGVSVLVHAFEEMTVDELRHALDVIKDRLERHVIVLGSSSEGKAILVCAVSKAETKTLQAGQIVKAAAKLVGGGGGGAPHSAQAGGKDPSKMPQALAHARELILEKLR